MPLPTFAPADQQARSATMNRTQAAAALGLNLPNFDKLIKTGVLSLPLYVDEVTDLASGRSPLRVIEGELTVLRTSSRHQQDPGLYPASVESRKWTGFHVNHTDAELEEASLRWWRCDPDRVLDNELFAVTVATFPVATYLITDYVRSYPRAGESFERHHFAGRLLARYEHGATRQRVRPQTPGHLKDRVEQIMNARIAVDSGGPIGYAARTV